MPYITDAAREYAKQKLAKDSADYIALFNVLAKCINDFDKEHGKDLWRMIHQDDLSEESLDESGPDVGSKLAYEYMKYLKQSNDIIKR